MRTLFATVLAASLAYAPANVDVDCTTMAKLARIAQAQVIASQDMSEGTIILAFNDVARAIVTLQPENVAYAMTDALSPDDRAILSQFMRQTESVLRLALTAEISDATTLLRAPESQDVLRNALTIIGYFECTNISMNDLNDRLMPAPTSSTNTQKPPENAPSAALSNVIDLLPIIFMVLGGLVAAGLSFLGVHMMTLRKRRSKRYALYYVVRWREAGAANEGAEAVFHDLNCYGAKLDHMGLSFLPQGTNCEVKIEGDWLPANVRWAKDNFIGLQFSKPLTRDRVKALVKISHTANAGLSAPPTESMA